ncbi:MAG: hypothetical protein SPI53_02020 [Erysipelotrichaceae bacterium]|nr:hypothetical protein [Erysipelotrichaceae bacterium]
MIKILKLYLTWMLIYTPLSIHHSVKVGWSFNKILSSYFQGLFYIGEQYNSWHLWYLLSTIYSLIIIIFFINKRVNLKVLIIMCLVFSIISISIDWLVALRMNMKALLLAQKLISNTIYNGRIFKDMIYIPLGMYLAHRPLKPSMNLLLFSGAFISNFFIVGASIHSLLIIISSVGFFGLIENIHLKDNGIYPMLRNMSIIIYLIHMYVWSIYYKIIYNNKTFGLDSFLITTITSMALAYLYLKIKNIVKKKINVLNYWYK